MEIFDKKLILNNKITFEGIKKINDIDLLALIIGRGAYSDTSYAKSSDYFEKLKGIEHFTAEQIGKIRGVNKNDKIFLESLIEFSNRIKERATEDIDIITNNHDIVTLFMPLIGNIPHEELWIACMNNSNRLVDKFLLSKGTTHNSDFDIRILMKRVIDSLASKVVMVHNHPCGILKPSQEDIDVTVKLKTAMDYFDISLIDHVIINKDKSYSMVNGGDLVSK